MRKILSSILICISIFTFSFSFSACNEPIKKHNIEIISSNTQNGNINISANGSYKTNYPVTLIATPLNGNKFIAWTKNDIIVSYESTYNFIANDETEGHYCALFSSSNLEFFKISSIKYDLLSLNIGNNPLSSIKSIKSIELKSSKIIQDLYTPLGVCKESAMPDTGNFTTEEFDLQEKVFYKIIQADKVQYYFQLNITFEYTDNNIVNEKSLTSTFNIDFNNFKEDKSTPVTQYTCDEYTLKLTKNENSYELIAVYDKLNTPEEWNEAKQCLTLTFTYPFEEQIAETNEKT